MADRSQFPKLVDGYNMLIWEEEDGSVSHTGSFNASEWSRYLADSGKAESAKADKPDKADKAESAVKSDDGAESKTDGEA